MNNLSLLNECINSLYSSSPKFPYFTKQHADNQLLKTTNNWNSAYNLRELASFADQLISEIQQTVKNYEEKLRSYKQLKRDLREYVIYCQAHPPVTQWEKLKAFFGQGKNVGLNQIIKIEEKLENDINTYEKVYLTLTPNTKKRAIHLIESDANFDPLASKQAANLTVNEFQQQLKLKVDQFYSSYERKMTNQVAPLKDYCIFPNKDEDSYTLYVISQTPDVKPFAKYRFRLEPSIHGIDISPANGKTLTILPGESFSEIIGDLSYHHMI